MSPALLSTTSTYSLRTRLPRSHSSLLELITKKTIDQISDLDFVAAQLVDRDEGVDDFRYPESSFFAFPQPLNTPHSRAQTIRLKMPAAKESDATDKVRISPTFLYRYHCRRQDVLASTPSDLVLTTRSKMAQSSLCLGLLLSPNT